MCAGRFLLYLLSSFHEQNDTAAAEVSHTRPLIRESTRDNTAAFHTARQKSEVRTIQPSISLFLCCPFLVCFALFAFFFSFIYRRDSEAAFFWGWIKKIPLLNFFSQLILFQLKGNKSSNHKCVCVCVLGGSVSRADHR